MHQQLTLHPDCRCEAVSAITVDVRRERADRIGLTYTLTGQPAALRIPSITAPARADNLWQTTCFEAFLRPDGETRYFEFNLSPSMRWAAYRFDDYRTGMAPLTEIAVREIAIDQDRHSLVLQATLELDELASATSWHMGLSAVIEEANGRKSYWALAHPPGKPDFHHSDCFALLLPAASQT